MDGQYTCSFLLQGGPKVGSPYAPAPQYRDFELPDVSMIGQVSLSSTIVDDEHGYLYLNFSEVVIADRNQRPRSIKFEDHMYYGKNYIAYNGVGHVSVRYSAFGASGRGLLNFFYWPGIA